MRVVVSQFEGIDATPVLPLAAGCLVAAARADAELAGVTLAIAIERAAIDRVVAELDRPDVLGFSLYPWNATYSLAVAAAARVAYPEALIVVGGPSVPRRPERARRFLDEQPAVDVLVFAEGELTFRAILRARRRGLPLDGIGGIAVRGPAGGAHMVTAAPGRVLDFAPTASPYLDGTFDELFARHRGRFAMALCETNRGCPFSCTFCDWSLTKKVVEFPIERVEAELAWVVAHGLKHVMLADANFGIRPRDNRIARYIAELKRRHGAPTSFYWYLTKNDAARNLETIDILQAAGIGTWVGLAVQDFDDDVLAAVKRDNIQTGESLTLRRICGERGIPTFNELILGLPGQTYASFLETMAQAMPGLPRHDFVLFLCRLIDNAELGSPESRAEFGLETRRCLWKTSTATWDPIIDEYQEVVVATRDLPPADWARAYRVAFLSAALYNLRLLRVGLHFVTDGAGAHLPSYLAFLVERLGEAPAGSVYAQLAAIFDRYVASLLSGGPFVLPLAAADGVAADDPTLPVYVEEAVATAALWRYDDFLAETEASTRAFLARGADATSTAASAIEATSASTEAAATGGADRLAEAFRYQALIIPRLGQDAPATATFAHDWPAYVAGGGTGVPLVARPVVVRYAPPTYTAVEHFAAFATTHFGVIRARLAAGEVEVVAPAPAAVSSASALPPVRPPRLVVLPTSG